MATTLEYRRLAIVNALRAVMAEPLPSYPTPEPPPAVETVLFQAPVTTTSSPSLREALVAEIQWDDAEDDLALAGDEVDLTNLHGLDELETFDDDWESPSVPPLETSGSFSRTASMALFGHA